MNKGYIRVPRSLLEDPLFKDLPPAYKEIFYTILELVCFRPQKFDDHGHIIELQPGQLCISERELLEKCNKWIDRNEIQRCIKKLILCQFVSRDVIHRKSIITITHKDTYDLILEASEPRSEPNLSQTRAKLEPETNKVNKANKENNNPQPPSKFEPFGVVGELGLFFEKLKLDRKLSGEDIRTIANYNFEYDRIKLAIEFVNAERLIKTTPLQTLIWHCKQSTPPPPNYENEWLQVNTAWFNEHKEGNPIALKHMKLKGWYVTNIYNQKDLSLKMNPEAFINAFIAVADVKVENA